MYRMYSPRKIPAKKITGADFYEGRGKFGISLVVPFFV